MKLKDYYIPSLLILFILILIIQDTSHAIPAFARKYKTSCSTCHEAIPKRNSFGEAFRRNGYLIPFDDMLKTKEKPVSLGADEWKEIWPDAIYPGYLPESFPISAYSLFRTSYKAQENVQGSRFSFEMPFLFNLAFGGTFGEDVSFFGEWSAFLAGQNANGLQRLFFQFNDVVGKDNLLNIRMGRFEPAITDGYTSTQRITSSSPITLSYGLPGGWRSSDEQSGIELNGIYNSRFYYASGVVNGEGKTIADPSDRKDVYARAAYMFGGIGLDGKDTSYIFSANAAEEVSVLLGAYAYLGSRNNIPLNGMNYNNEFMRYGADINLRLNKFNLLGGILLGVDENPDADLIQINSTVFFVEGDYMFYPWLIGILRFEKAGAEKGDNEINNFINIIPNITMLYRANVRFSIEGLVKIFGERNINGAVVSASNKKPLQNVSVNAYIAF